jgi:hypothetical protein
MPGKVFSYIQRMGRIKPAGKEAAPSYWWAMNVQDFI